MPSVATVAARSHLLHPHGRRTDPVDKADSCSPLASPTASTTAASSPQTSPRRFQSRQASVPPPGARPPTMIRRASRFDPIDGSASPSSTDDGASHGDLGTRHPLRRIREDVAPHEAQQQSSSSSRQDSGESVSLPGIKALLNVADQPPLLSSPFGNSLFSSPTAQSASSAMSPLDSPRSRTSRFSSFASSEPGWWAPDDRDRSGSLSSASQPRGSFSRGPLNEEPDYKRRRSDLPPALEDADEVARLKWQAQSRNASFPVSGSMSGASGGHGLRTMLYPPIASGSRGSIPGGNLPSPLSPSIESTLDGASHPPSMRSSPMTGPLARSFAELTANDSGPSDRRPSALSRRSNDSIPPLGPSRRESVASLVAPDDHPGRSLTRPPSPEPSKQGAPRRSSLAELIMVQSGDDVAMRRPKENQYLSGAHVKNGDAGSPKLFHLAPRRESTDSGLSVTSVPAFSSDPLSPKRVAAHNGRRGSAASTPKPSSLDPRRSSFASTVGGADEDELDVRGDPGMHGMEVLAESARRVADAERNKTGAPSNNASSNGDLESSSPKAAGSSSGPKYTCQFCHKTFSRPSSLRIHTYSRESDDVGVDTWLTSPPDTGERPYVCKEPTCRRRFSVQSNLKRHAKVHQIQAQQQQASQMAHQAHPRSVPPPHPGHMGGPMGHPPPPPVYNYAGRPPHPGAPPHMGHPSMGPGYHGPPPSFMHGGHPYDMGPHRGGPPPPGQSSHGPPHDVGPMHYRPRGGPPPAQSSGARRAGRNGFGGGAPGSGPGPQGEWVTDEEDELDDDVHCKREPA